MTTSHPKILIVASVRPCSGGFIPQITVNGRERWDWRAKGYDRADAETMARDLAKEESERWIGDWDIEIREEFKS